MTTIFSKIIAREIPAVFVYEDDICVVIMDKFPAVPGQTLVISKREVDYILDLTDEEYAHLFTVAKRVARASDRAFSAVRSCLVIEGFEVPHVHIKIYPMATTDKSIGVVMSKQSEQSDEQLQKDAEEIRNVLIEASN